MFQEDTPNPKKNLVSIRVKDANREQVLKIADRLLVKESKLYRLAINILLTQLSTLHSSNAAGSDLLPLFISLRGPFLEDLDFKPLQLHRIINKFNADPDKFVQLEDVVLLLSPDHLLRDNLRSNLNARHTKDKDTHIWLHNYLLTKYGILPLSSQR